MCENERLSNLLFLFCYYRDLERKRGGTKTLPGLAH